MRKIITSSVLILLFSLFSGQVFAGKIEACENIKHDPAYKGLYGLCNAYWNANEKAQDKILAKFIKKAGPGGPVMPGLEPVVICPCWANGELDSAVFPYDYQVFGTFAFASYDVGGNQFFVDANYCGHIDITVSPPILAEAFPGDDESTACFNELTEAIERDF